MNSKYAPIGAFDSGVGGLTVVKEIMRQLPNERVVYFGDTARVPYGNKSEDTITKYTKQIIRFLRTYNVKALVVACNTISACALEEVEKELDIPIIGVLKPGSKTAAEKTVNGHIGVIATESTIHSGMYEKFIKQINQETEVYTKACPLFVPLVEEGLWEDSVTYEIARRYLQELMDQNIDTLILGCTHYPMLKKTIGEVVGDKVTLVNPAYETARELKELLENNGLLNIAATEDYEVNYKFFVSDVAERFQEFANSILSDIVFKTDTPFTTTRVNIENY